MAVPVVEGAKEKLAGAWAYLRSIPPHVWVGLAIGAAALILAYIAWKNRSTSLSPLSSVTAGSDPNSTLSPVSDPGTFIPQNPQASYYNYQQAQIVTPDKPKITGPIPHYYSQGPADLAAAAAARAQAALNAVYNQNESNAQNVAIKSQQAAQARAAAVVSVYNQNESNAQNVAIRAAQQAAQAAQKVVPIFRPTRANPYAYAGYGRPTGRGANVSY